MPPPRRDVGSAPVPRNQFSTRPAQTRADVLEVLKKWGEYVSYKDKKLQREPDRTSDPRYANFSNSRTMIKMATKSLEEMSDEDVPKRVRLAHNQDGNLAGLMVHGSEPEVGEQSYVDDLLANPKGLVPSRGQRRLTKPPRPQQKNRPKIITGSKSSLKGGGRALLEKAASETGEGLKLWPLDPATTAQYLKMDFDGTGFEEEQDGHLTLKLAK